MKKFLLIAIFPALIFATPEEEILEKLQEAQRTVDDFVFIGAEDIYGLYFYEGRIEAYKDCLNILEKAKIIEEDTF